MLVLFTTNKILFRPLICQVPRRANEIKLMKLGGELGWKYAKYK